MNIFKDQNFSKKVKSEILCQYPFYLFLLFYILGLIILSVKLVIWNDEAYSLTTTSNSLLKVIHLSYNFEGQPPVYFVVLTLWRKISSEIFFARLLSIVFTLLAAFLLNSTLKIIFKKIYSRWVIVLFLLNPFVVWASVEIRTYSLLIFLSMVSIYLFYRIYYYKNDFKYKLIFVLVCIIGTYTQYFFVFVVVTFSVILLISKGWRTFFRFCGMAIPIALLFLPNLLFIGKEASIHQNIGTNNSLSAVIHQIYFAAEELLMDLSYIPFGRYGRWIGRLLLGILIFLSILKLSKKKIFDTQNEHWRIIEIMISIVILFLTFSSVFYITNIYFNIRYLAAVFPFIALIYITINAYGRTFSTVIYGLIAAFFIFILIETYQPPYIKTYNSKLIANYVERIEQPDEPIFFYAKTIALPFGFYYDGINNLHPLPKLKFDLSYYDVDLKDTTELKQYIQMVEEKSNSLLFINGTDLGFTSKKR